MLSEPLHPQRIHQELKFKNQNFRKNTYDDKNHSYG